MVSVHPARMTSRPGLSLRARISFRAAGVLLAVTALTLGCAALRAGESETEHERYDLRERVLRMTEFLDTMLPGVLEENNITVHFTPKFSDVRDHEYIRYPLELRYGAGNGWEYYGGPTPFSPNPINSGHDHRWGLGEIRLGARYDYGPSLDFFTDTTFGLETRVPVGRPPIELNDHYTHIKPFVSAARTLESWPDVTFYANASYDRSVRVFPRDPPPPEVVRRNIIEVSPGYLYKPDELGYFIEYRFRHYAEDHDTYLGHEFRLGTLWDIPLWRTARHGLPGKWQLELAYRANHEEGRGTDHGIVARVNWRTTLREVLQAARR